MYLHPIKRRGEIDNVFFSKGIPNPIQQTERSNHMALWDRNTTRIFITAYMFCYRFFFSQHSLKLTVCSEKKVSMVSQKEIHLPTIDFQGRANSFRKGTHHQSNHWSTQTTSRGPCRTFLQLLVQAMLKLL